MLRSQDMVKASLFAHKKDKEKILAKLHELGIIQLIDLKGSKEVKELQNAAPAEDVKELSDLLLRISRINTILNLAPIEKTFSQKIFGLETTNKGKVKRKNKTSIIIEAEKFLKEYEKKLIALEEEHTKLHERLDELNEAASIIEILEDHELPIDLFRETKNILFVSGRMQTNKVSQLKSELEKELKKYCHVESRDEGKKESIVIITSLKEHAAKVNFLVKKFGMNTFAKPNIPLEVEGKTIENPLEYIETEEEKIDNLLDKNIGEIEKFHKKAFDETIFLREELELLKEKFEAIHKLKESKSFFVMQGWVTSKQLDILKENIINAIIKEDEPEEKDRVPVELSNPWFLKPFEVLTELYAMPNYKDLDPTFIVGPIFVIYAGFMLTDFVYGLGLVILGAVLFKLFKEHAQGIKDISISIIGIGLFSMLFGVLTGSYLGDAPKYFFGLPTAKLAIWKDPLADPLYFLIISLAVGLIHLNIGLVLGLVEDIRKKEWKNMLSDRIIWWLLQISILAFVLNYSLLGKIILGITLVLVVILQGPLGLLGMTGFMGDVISYSRLFALALSTAGIAMTVNLLAGMLSGVPYVGFLFAAIIFIGGHLFSFAMNALGSFVHSIRLQYVEFFGKFYEGGGDRFSPFKEERVYTEVDEE